MKAGALLSFAVWTLVLGVLGFFFYDLYERRAEERRLREQIARLTEEERRARILVDAVLEDPATGQAEIHLRWVETDPQGDSLPGVPPRSLVVRGREAYFDALQIHFDTELVREGDPLRGRTLTLFARVYGDDQKPREGVSLDLPPGVMTEPGPGGSSGAPALVPPFYQRLDAPGGSLQEHLWNEFWKLCTDADFARAEGVRTAQGTAVHKPMVAGKEYRLILNREGRILLEGPFEPDPFVKTPPD